MLSLKFSKNSSLLAKLTEEVQNIHHKIDPNQFKPFDEKAYKLYFEESLTQKDSFAIIAYKNEEPVGYIFYQKIEVSDNAYSFPYSFIYLNHIAILDRFKRNGYGEKLILKLKEIAASENIDTITLSQWTKNTDAGEFFKKNGFQQYRQNLELKI